jgi:Raf kinase inhibitor-like YbhB/YbcL family protein
MRVKSSVINEKGFINVKYTCDGLDISPPVEWSQAPEGTKTFALICDDPDAPMGTWVHWVVYNIPGTITKLAENVPRVEVLENGTKQGKNDFKRTGYGGPCPPGGAHRYYFKVYALDEALEVDTGISKKELVACMEGHILAEGHLIGKYKRGKG